MLEANATTLRRNRRSRATMALFAAALLGAALAAPAAARDCRDEARHEMDLINARAAAVNSNDDMSTLCRGIAAQIRSYESIIALFRDPECGAGNPAAGIAQMTAKVDPLRTAYAKYCH